MTPSLSASFRTLTFGDLGASVWGAAWIHGESGQGFVGLGAGDRQITPAASLHDAGESEDWRLEGDGVELTASAMGIALAGSGSGSGSASRAGADGPSGFDQLCRVHGRVALEGAEREIDCIGRRGAYGEGVDVERLESVRDVSAWFEPADGLALVALRPRKSRGQDGDLVTAVVFDSAPHTITDPRLSTTYTAAGRPLRAGVEMWLGESEGEQYPRRALGEALGDGATGRAGRFEVSAQPFHWQSRGRDGAGMYLLARQA
jgi:hypothetical protein